MGPNSGLVTSQSTSMLSNGMGAGTSFTILPRCPPSGGTTVPLSSRKPQPSAAAAPIPASLVALPPIARMARRAPRRLASSSNCPGAEGRGQPRIALRQGEALQAAGFRHFHHTGLAVGRQAIAALYVCGPAGRRRFFSIHSSPRGRRSTSSKPSPPSDRGAICATVAWGWLWARPAADGAAYRIGGQGVLEGVQATRIFIPPALIAKPFSGLASPSCAQHTEGGGGRSNAAERRRERAQRQSCEG